MEIKADRKLWPTTIAPVEVKAIYKSLHLAKKIIGTMKVILSQNIQHYIYAAMKSLKADDIPSDAT